VLLVALNFSWAILTLQRFFQEFREAEMTTMNQHLKSTILSVWVSDFYFSFAIVTCEHLNTKPSKFQN
jgi:hypothetical protein